MLCWQHLVQGQSWSHPPKRIAWRDCSDCYHLRPEVEIFSLDAHGCPLSEEQCFLWTHVNSTFLGTKYVKIWSTAQSGTGVTRGSSYDPKRQPRLLGRWLMYLLECLTSTTSTGMLDVDLDICHCGWNISLIFIHIHWPIIPTCTQSSKQTTGEELVVQNHPQHSKATGIIIIIQLSWMEHQQNNIPKPTANHIIFFLSSWNGHCCWIFIRHFINCSRFLQLETVVHDSSLVSPIFVGLHTAIYSYSHSYFHGLSSNCSVSFSVV